MFNLQDNWQIIKDYDLTLLSRYRLFTYKKIYYFSDSLMSIFNEIFSNIANNTSKLNPQNYNEEVLSVWLKLLLLIPGMLFRQAASINIIKSRIILFKNGDWGALLEELRTDLISPKQYKKSKKYEGNHSVTDSDFRYKNAAKIITEDGDLSKAFQAIVSPTTISPPTTESVEYLKSLHPQRTEDNEIPEDLLNHVSRLNNIPEATVCEKQREEKLQISLDGV